MNKNITKIDAPTELKWKCHTKNLFDEIIECSGVPVLRVPLNICYTLIQKVADRCAEINDPKLNALMVQLTMYTIADPEHEDFDPEQVKAIMQESLKRKGQDHEK